MASFRYSQSFVKKKNYLAALHFQLLSRDSKGFKDEKPLSAGLSMGLGVGLVHWES
jgi:hypothetical protein